MAHLGLSLTLWFLLKGSWSFVPQRPLCRRPEATNHLFFSSLTANDNKYLRWKKEDDAWKMQTAVTVFQRGNQTVELHAQLHFGDAEYFEFYSNSEDFKKHDSVHYELLIDESLLSYDHGRWQLNSPITASPNDQQLGNSLGWKCQADSIDYTKPNWIHADFTRQEFVKLSEAKEGSSSTSGNTPLWQLASWSHSSSAAAEAMSALLVGPPTLSYSARFLKRRLFTNLFLPGNALANQLRAALWFTVPAPELSILLFDWSTLFLGSRSSGIISSSKNLNPSGLSQVALPILSSLFHLNIRQTRQFLFGQVLVSSASTAATNDSSNWSLIVTKRNDHALGVLEKSCHDKKSSSSKYSTALLYGSMHCPDLHNKLTKMGFVPINTWWRTAWSVQEQAQKETFWPALFLLGIFLSVGALDWIGVMGGVSLAWEQRDYGEAGLAAGLYLVRHVLLYLGLSKFLVDWNNQNEEP
jgi:hypothetical protein